MFNISSYFEKFKNIERTKEREINVIKEVLKKNFNSEIDFDIDKNTIKIKNNFSAKNDLFIKKGKILSDLKEYLPNRFTDIV